MRSFVICMAVLFSLSMGDVLLDENFNSAWSTGSPPPGWRIFETGPAPGKNDWHPEDAYTAPWTSHPTRYAAIFTDASPEAPPDSLISPVLDFTGYRSVKLYVTTYFRRRYANPYEAVLCYSIDGGVTFDTIRNYYHQYVNSSESFDLPAAADQANVIIAWVFDGDLNDIYNWCIDDVRVEAKRVIFDEDFDSAWSTGSPPPGWRIFHTGPAEGSDDWHREDANALPWTDRLSPYAGIYWNLHPDASPDTLITEPIDCSGRDNITLHVTTLFNRQLSNSYTALLRYSTDGGATFRTIHNYYDEDVNGQEEVFSLSYARNQANVVIAWIFDGDLGNIKWWCIDDVWVEGDTVLNDDVSCRSITTPSYTETPGNITPVAVFRNNGLNGQTNIQVGCRLYDAGMNPIRTWTEQIPDLPSGEQTSVTFSPSVNLTTAYYNIEFWSEAMPDDDRSNDTLRRYFHATYVKNLSYCSSSPRSYADWPVGHYGYGVRFSVPSPTPAYLESAKVYLDCPSSNPEHCRYQLAMFTEAAGGGPGEMYWKSPVLDGYDGWNSFYMADTGEQIVLPGGDFYMFYLQVGEPPECPSLGVDSRLNYSDRNWEYRAGDVKLDTPPGDFLIRVSTNHDALATPPSDIRTLYVDMPWYDFVQRPFDAPITPRARFDNPGATGSGGFTAVCSILGQSNVVRYVDAVNVAALPGGADTLISFQPWIPQAAGRCSVIVRNRLSTAPVPVPQNDDKRFTVDVIRGKHTGVSGLHYGWIDSDSTDGPVYDWIDTTGAGVALASGDEAHIFVPIGFDFPFYDTSYSNVIVCTNGWMSLGYDQFTNESMPAKLPSPSLPNKCIYPWWDNLALGPGYGGGRVYFKYQGIEPYRRCTIIWQDVWRVSPDGDTTNGISFEATLDENGTITFQYKDVDAGNPFFNNGRYACIGLENETGTDGLTYLYARPPMSSAVNDLGNRLTSGRAIMLGKIYRDAAALDIVSPEHYEYPGIHNVVAKIRSLGSLSDTIKVYMHINPAFYSESLLVTDLRARDSVEITFRPCSLSLGTYTAICSTAMRGDTIPENNSVTKKITVSAWVQKEDIPSGWMRRRVKSAALVYVPTMNRLYAMKGSNCSELWYYDLETGEWDTSSLAPMPLDSSGRRPKDGCALAFDPLHGTKGFLWATKGGGRTDFYSYDIAADTWMFRPPMFVPAWEYRPPKKGAAIVFYPGHGMHGCVYAIPGNGSRLFYRYDVGANRWEAPLDPDGNILMVPRSVAKPFATCKHGSDMVYDGDDNIYVLLGSNTLDAFVFSPSESAWVDTLHTRTLIGPRLKKVKGGASMACLDDYVFVLKGGNTQEFWSYHHAQTPLDSWARHTDIPIAAEGRRRKVKRGSAMEAAGSSIFCLKGSYTNEFWEYRPSSEDLLGFPPAARPERSGVAASPGSLPNEYALDVRPNPSEASVAIDCAIPATAHARMRVYDRNGRLVRTLFDSPLLRGRHSFRWNGLDNRGRRVAPGVYILRLENGGNVLTRKLVIQY